MVMKCHVRASILYCCILLCLFALCLRLYILSDVNNKALTVLDGQYTGRLDITERSGFIYDRYFDIISHDACTGILVVNPNECSDIKAMTSDISKITAVNQSELVDKIHEGIPFTVWVNNKGSAERMSEKYNGLYYCETYEENTSTAQHFIGYSRDGEGVTGLRKYENDLLYHKLYEKKYATFSNNALSMSMSPLSMQDKGFSSTDGIITTLDSRLQRFCDGLEDEVKSGCIIVADASNGDILAMSSFPSYDTALLEDYLFSKKGELINRALSSFTPGSVFKIIVSACALEEDEAYYEFKHECKGSIQVYDTTFNCHKKSGHGEISMKDAFALSCNCYYVALARQLGLDKIAGTAKKLGLDKPMAADFLTETSHSFIDESSDLPGYLANISFGQGDLCLSPIDMISVMISACTGYSCKLHTILGEVKDGRAEYRQETEKTAVFSNKTVEMLCRMMEECVNSGTGRSAKIEGVRIGGKTGTAQTGRFDGNGVEYVHKWFCGFYDGLEKRYVFSVLCDNSTEKNSTSCVVSSEIFAYLKENKY